MKVTKKERKRTMTVVKKLEVVVARATASSMRPRSQLLATVILKRQLRTVITRQSRMVRKESSTGLVGDMLQLQLVTVIETRSSR